MNKHMKLLLIMLIAAMILPAGIAAFAASGAGGGGTAAQPSALPEAAEEVVLSPEALSLIFASAPAEYDKQVNMYKKAIVTYRIPTRLQEVIEDLMGEGYKLPDILTGYSFLYHRFGTAEDLRKMLADRLNGDSWTAIFTADTRERPVFVPRTFDSGQLERLLNTPSLRADDIMIADRLSFVTGETFEDIIERKQTEPHWQVIASQAGVLFSADELPRVQITSEQLHQFTDGADWTEERVTAAFVVAHQLGLTPEDVIAQMKSGKTEEAIAAAVYEAAYR